jgi:MraZ protein
MVVTYSGTSDHGLDDKGRLTLPARILDQVAKNEWKFYLSAGLDPCLLLHDQQGWETLAARIGSGVPGSPAHRNLCRRFLGNSEEVVPDSTRRIRIPESLLEYAGLAPSQPIRLLGMGRVLEIWSPERLGKALAVASSEEETLFASLVDPRTPSAPRGA